MSMSGRFVLVLVLLAGVTGPAVARAAAPGFGTPALVSPFVAGHDPGLAIDPTAAPPGALYVTTSPALSTGDSPVFRSGDAGQSFHPTGGDPLGRPPCASGTASDLVIDPVDGRLLYAALLAPGGLADAASPDGGQTWSAACDPGGGTAGRPWIGLDTSGATTAVGDSAADGRAYQASGDGAHRLLVGESVDGVHYGSACATAGSSCAGAPALASRDEGVPGNVVVDNTSGPFRHRVYAVHTGALESSVILSWCAGRAGDASAAAVAADCADPAQADPADPGSPNVNWHDVVVRPPGAHDTGHRLASVAVDQAGAVYVVWSEYPVAPVARVEDGPGTIRLAVSTDGGQHFGAARVVSPASLGNNVMPWVTAGSAGQVGIAWYGASQAEERGRFGPDTLAHGVWNVYYAQSSRASGPTAPAFTVVPVSDHPVKFGAISTQGAAGTADPSLGDRLEVGAGRGGEAVVAYVDETSAARTPGHCEGCGPQPAQAAGPAMVARQDVGAGLLAGQSQPLVAALPFGSVADPVGTGSPDAFLSTPGGDTAATPNLDIAGVQVTRADRRHLEVRMTTADPDLAHHLAVAPSLGGTFGRWIVRWAAPAYHGQGDGNSFYVGMQAGPDGGPQLFTGTTCTLGAAPADALTYPATTAVPGGINGATITWTVPLAAIGAPAAGQSMFSITGLTAVRSAAAAPTGTPGCGEPPSAAGMRPLPSLIDASPPFTYTIGGRAAAPAGTPGSGRRPDGDGAMLCDTPHGFSGVSVVPHGHGLRIAFARAVPHPVAADVLQVSHGGQVAGKAIVARFRGRSSSLTWSGRRQAGRSAPSDGVYEVRLAMGLAAGARDVRQVAMVRSGGRFRARPSFARSGQCGEIGSFALSRPVFGAHAALGISYRLRDDASVTMTVLRGRRVVHRWRATRRLQHRVYRLRLPAGRLAGGDYDVVLRAVEPGATTTRRLVARRL